MSLSSAAFIDVLGFCHKGHVGICFSDLCDENFKKRNQFAMQCLRVLIWILNIANGYVQLRILQEDYDVSSWIESFIPSFMIHGGRK